MKFTLYYSIEAILVLVPMLLSVAFMTIIERKVLARMQRRIGPNAVGYLGVLQPFSDALKLLTKENVLPQNRFIYLFLLAPLISLVFSLFGWAIIPYGTGLTLIDFSLGLLYTLGISSVGIYGILLAGWAANRKYAFLGSLRRTAQMIRYELVFRSCLLCIIFATGRFNLTHIIEVQDSIWFIIPFLPVSIMWFIRALAETNRTPFDLPEAESELVAGFFTEHSSAPFVLFFLAEYSSIVLMSTLLAILFLGGYRIPYLGPYISIESIRLGIKSALGTFLFVWFRATLPRLRYDQLMIAMWTGMLPIVVAFLLLIPSILVALDYSPIL